MGSFKEEAVLVIYAGRIGGYGARGGVSVPLRMSCMYIRRGRRGKAGRSRRSSETGFLLNVVRDMAGKANSRARQRPAVWVFTVGR